MRGLLPLPRRARWYAGPACPHCNRPLDPATVEDGPTRCAGCGRRFVAQRFAGVEGAGGAGALAEAGPSAASACAAHPRNAAPGACERCGVFMCGLCRVDSDGLALCPACFNRLAREDALPSLKLRFVDYGARASSAAAIGFLFCLPLGLVAGPLAVYYAARGLRQPTETLGSKTGIVFAGLIGFAEFALTAFMWGGMWLRW